MGERIGNINLEWRCQEVTILQAKLSTYNFIAITSARPTVLRAVVAFPSLLNSFGFLLSDGFEFSDHNFVATEYAFGRGWLSSHSKCASRKNEDRRQCELASSAKSACLVLKDATKCFGICTYRSGNFGDLRVRCAPLACGISPAR